jgi:hypothetical protein
MAVERVRISYPGYFADGQECEVIRRYKSAVIDWTMVEIIAAYQDQTVRVTLPASCCLEIGKP